MTRRFNTRRHAFRGSGQCAGVASVEFVIAVPVLIVVMLATAELGRAFLQYDTLSYSVRNGARYMSEHAIQGDTGVVLVQEPFKTTAWNLVVYGDPAAGGPPILPDLDSTGTVVVREAGSNDIEISATYPYQSLFGGALPSIIGDAIPTAFDLHVSVTMRAIS